MSKEKPLKIINELYAFIADNPGEGEGVLGVLAGGHWTPLIAADLARLEDFRPHAQMIANMVRRPVKLIKLTTREDLEVLSPVVAG